MLKADHVTRRYGCWTALDDVSFEIQTGELVGLLGPNGSGKTTLLRIISNYLLPHQGTVTIDGLDVTRNPIAIKKILGYLPESNILYEQMRVDKFLLFVAQCRELSGNVLKERFDWCIYHCQLEQFLQKKCGECSRGMKQRVAFAASIIHDPKIILLDEPTAGLDPVQSLSFRNLISSLSKDRVILMSSHIISEVASTTNRVLIIHNSHLIEDTATVKNNEELENLFLKAIGKENETGMAPADIQFARPDTKDRL